MILVTDAGQAIYFGDNDMAAIKAFDQRWVCYRPEFRDNVKIYRCLDITEHWRMRSNT